VKHRLFLGSYRIHMKGKQKRGHSDIVEKCHTNKGTEIPEKVPYMMIHLTVFMTKNTHRYDVRFSFEISDF
jgi:hypothetical protein